jgi:serine/threonine protein phosphatase PrpC
VTGDERVALRCAVAFEPGKYGPEFSRDAAYAGPHLLVVADGIQNMSSPDSPSNNAIGKLRYLDAPAEPSDLTMSIENGLAGLRETFRQLLVGDSRWMGTGTVLTAMLWQDIHAVIAHIGDTRAYMLRDNELTQLTQDHTIRQVLLDEGRISPGDPEFDSKHSAVIRWLDGESSEPEDVIVHEAADVIVHEAALGDRYLLSTDGVHEVLSPEILRDCLRGAEGDPQAAVDRIVREAAPAKHYDNFTCIVADVVSQLRVSWATGPILAGAAAR